MDPSPETDTYRYLPLPLPPQQDGCFIGSGGIKHDEHGSFGCTYPENSASYGRMEMLSEVAHVRLSLAESPLVADTEPLNFTMHCSQSKNEMAYTALARFFEQSESLCESVSQMRRAFEQVSGPVLQNPKGLYDSQLLYATNSTGVVYSTDTAKLSDFATTIPNTMTQDLEAALCDISNTLAAILYLKAACGSPGLGESPDIGEDGMSKPSGEKRPRYHASRSKMLSIMPSRRLDKIMRTKKMLSNKVCANCKAIDAPEWRRGPDGARSLCNACGLFYKKLVTKYGYEDADCIYYYRRIGDSVDRTVPGVLEKNLIVQHSRRSSTILVDSI